MKLRKVTAIEEKVLALAVEWAEMEQRVDVEAAANQQRGAVKSLKYQDLCDACHVASNTLLKSAADLLKQRAKGEKK